MTARTGLAVALALGLVGGKSVWDFEKTNQGGPAPGLHAETGTWKVVRENAKNFVLAQTARNEDAVFNLALSDDAAFRDVTVSVRVRAMAGEIDQGGGVVWRAKDANNYYVCRYNPLEDNFRVFKVKDGKRSLLKGTKVPGDNEWHTIRVVMKGPKIACDFDGKTLLDVEDTTFPDAGRIGLWCKADAQSQFDDLAAEGD